MCVKRRFRQADEVFLNQAYDIAWHFVSTTGRLDDENLVPQAYLAAHILGQFERGERRPLALANRAISAFARSTDPEGDAARALGVA